MFVWAKPAVQLNLPVAVSPANLDNFGAYMRDIYRVHYAHEFAAGAVKPLVFPSALLGTIVLPVLYLAVPHVRRPWLYRARWLLMALIVVHNVHETWTSSSAHLVMGYGVGLMQAWGILWAATLLIWMRPQFEAERVARRRRTTMTGSNGHATTVANGNGHAITANGNGHAITANGNGHAITANGNGHAPTANGDGNGNGYANGYAKGYANGYANGYEKQNGHAIQANGHHQRRLHHHTDPLPNGKKEMVVDDVDAADAPDEDVARSIREGYEYYWQAYPADAPLATRLGWSLDLVLSFRGIGWNWGVSIIPQFAKPKVPLSGELVDLRSIPLATRQGYRRYRTTMEWLRANAPFLAFGYLIMDLASVLMMKDPYFILGPEFAAAAAGLEQQQRQTQYQYPLQRLGGDAVAPENPLALPPLLASLPPAALGLYRSLICAVDIVVAINLLMVVSQGMAHLLLPHAWRIHAGGELWQCPSTFGAFVPNVLDRGLAGFWGGWWHQTFRVTFTAPGHWLARRGWLNVSGKGRGAAWGQAVTGFIAFAQSGFLHTLGSVSCLPPTKPWLPMVFFLMCWVGIVVQVVLSAALNGLLGLVLRPAADGSSSSSPKTETKDEKSRKRQASLLPRWLRRAGNLLFVCVWLQAVQGSLCDDLGRSGLWLLEPVPVSPMRALGLGKPGDAVWRWDEALLPGWYNGGSRWWETGVAL